MARKLNIYLFLFIYICSNAFIPTAESAVATSLSLEGALRLAYQNNPRMIMAREEVKASKGRWIQSEALPKPEVGLEVGGLKKSEGSRKGSVDSFSIKQPLDALGTRFLGASMAKDGVRIAKKDIELACKKSLGHHNLSFLEVFHEHIVNRL